MQINQVGCKIMEIWCGAWRNRNKLKKIECSMMETNGTTQVNGNNYKKHDENLLSYTK
jgi:hypothetical protein